MSRRAFIASGTAAAATGTALAVAQPAFAQPEGARQGADPARSHGAPVAVTINGSPAALGRYDFPAQVDTLVFDNGLVRFTFTRNDGLTGAAPVASASTSLTVSSVIVDGVELAHNLTGQSYYVDSSGGKAGLAAKYVRVARLSPDLVDIAIVDDASTPLQHEHHVIMRRGRRALYGYDIVTAPAATQINEIRLNTRWDRGIFDHAYNWERGSGQQPTYAYLNTQERVGDETWRIDGVNDPTLPVPESNAGNLPAGTVYSKYEWSLYHHENPMFGHYGHGFGVWFTPLGGVTDETLCAFYGVGPDHQDLAIHQDAIVLNYFGANHYGLPAYDLPAGYRRLYGPWVTYLNTGDANDPDALIADAAATARAEIAENRAGSAWVADSLYPQQRTTVTGRVRVTDGRPASDLWVLLSTQDVTDVYTIHEPTYFVRTDADGRFTLPGIPPAWKPGTTDPGTYQLYVFSAGGYLTDQFKKTGIVVRGSHQDLGNIDWSPTKRTTHLWQIGRSDGKSGEFALAAVPATHANPRDYAKPSLVPGTLDFTVGKSWEPEDWYYAQTNPGVWTVHFTLDRVPTGTAYLTVATSMQQSSPPTIAVNGTSDGITGTLPAQNDSTIARQADRSGYPRTAVLSFPATLLVAGANVVTLTKGAGNAGGNGLGWDTIVLEVDEDAGAPTAAPARLSAQALDVRGPAAARVWRFRVSNFGGPARDVRLDAFSVGADATPKVTGRDPQRFSVPVAEVLPRGGSAIVEVTTDQRGRPLGTIRDAHAAFSSDGGRARAKL
jgi:rhamnogalacturonan endolyase